MNIWWHIGANQPLQYSYSNDLHAYICHIDKSWLWTRDNICITRDCWYSNIYINVNLQCVLSAMSNSISILSTQRLHAGSVKFVSENDT